MGEGGSKIDQILVTSFMDDPLMLSKKIMKLLHELWEVVVLLQAHESVEGLIPIIWSTIFIQDKAKKLGCFAM